MKGYAVKPGTDHVTGHYGGKPTMVSPNHLDRRFNVTAANVARVTDITCVRT